MKKIIIASNNSGKIKEFKKIFEPLGVEVISQAAAGVFINPDETGTTFAENSSIKARALYEITGSAVIADDSGLEVDALGGAPGVYSHRFAGENAADEEKCRYILEKLSGKDENERTARFICDICYIDEKGRESHAEGRCEGKIGSMPKGSNGFGYDPIFMYGDKSFAELSEAEKNKVSHRARAIENLKSML